MQREFCRTAIYTLIILVLSTDRCTSAESDTGSDFSSAGLYDPTGRRAVYTAWQQARSAMFHQE